MADIYMIASINSDGKRIESYAMPNMRRHFQRSMAEEYGNVEVTPMTFEELPADVLKQVKNANVALFDE